MILLNGKEWIKYKWVQANCPHFYPFSEFDTFWGKYDYDNSTGLIDFTKSEVEIYDELDNLNISYVIDPILYGGSSVTNVFGSSSIAYANLYMWQDYLNPAYQIPVPTDLCVFYLKFIIRNSNNDILGELYTPYMKKVVPGQNLITLQAGLDYQQVYQDLSGEIITGTNEENCWGVSMNFDCDLFSASTDSGIHCDNPWGIISGNDLTGYRHRISFMGNWSGHSPSLRVSYYENDSCTPSQYAYRTVRNFKQTYESGDGLNIEMIRQYAHVLGSGRILAYNFPEIDATDPTNFGEFEEYTLASDTFVTEPDDSCCPGLLEFNLASCECLKNC